MLEYSRFFKTGFRGFFQKANLPKITEILNNVPPNLNGYTKLSPIWHALLEAVVLTGSGERGWEMWSTVTFPQLTLKFGSS